MHEKLSKTLRIIAVNFAVQNVLSMLDLALKFTQKGNKS